MFSFFLRQWRCNCTFMTALPTPSSLVIPIPHDSTDSHVCRLDETFWTTLYMFFKRFRHHLFLVLWPLNRLLADESIPNHTECSSLYSNSNLSAHLEHIANFLTQTKSSTAKTRNYKKTTNTQRIPLPIWFSTSATVFLTLYSYGRLIHIFSSFFSTYECRVVSTLSTNYFEYIYYPLNTFRINSSIHIILHKIPS